MTGDTTHALDQGTGTGLVRCGKTTEEVKIPDPYAGWRPAWRFTRSENAVTRADGVTCQECIDAPLSPLAFKRWPMSQWHDFRAVKNDLCEKCSEYQWDVRMSHGAGSSTLAQVQTEEAANLIVEALSALRKSQLA